MKNAPNVKLSGKSMSKRSLSPHQPSLFQREVPQMPEGYYSSGPNPNLHRFVEEHAKPYDPATDDYNLPPFDQSITTTKTTAVYNMHSYHQGKKPHDAIRQYIRHYTKPGDLILDPFCGSGGTGLASLMEGRAVIAIDLSPAATFITKNYCTPMNMNYLQQAFEELQCKLKPEMEWLYETRCDRCDGRATTAYTVYSYVFQCPRCLEKVALFDCPESKVETAAGKPKTIHICPYCQQHGHSEEIKTSSPRFDPIPVLISYLCEHGCKPQEDKRRINDINPKKRSYFEQYDLGKLQEIEKRPIPHWVPPHRMMNVESDTEPWGDKWRAGTSSFRTVAKLFTKRNLWAISSYYENAKNVGDPIMGGVLVYAINAIVLAMSRMQGFIEDPRFPNQLMRGTYYLPQISKEYNVSQWYRGKIRNLLAGYQKIDEEIATTSLLISTQSSIRLEDIVSQTVDYIFTDPPYSNNVQYGELNFVWEAWLNFNTHWHSQEIIVNETRNKTEFDWADLMRLAMKECYRVLKPSRWLSLCYHDTSEGTWQLVQDIMTEAGFIPEKSESALYIDTGQKSYNQLTAEKVTKRDLVINFRKPRREELTPSTILTGEEDAATFTEKARLILGESLEDHPGTTSDRLYDELVSRMVRRGEFQRHNFDELLRSVAEEVNGRWYLLETAGHVDETESKKEAAAAERLEGYMQKALSEQHDALGVHYSDLFEQYLPIQDKPRRLLQDWLPEFFYKTSAGTWRPPANDEERQQKASLRSSGALRRIKRFANALMDGVPPPERDRPENAVTLADWIRQCRRAGLFELGRVLYEKGGLRFDALNEETQLIVEEDYQICVGRSEKKASKPKAKGKQLSLMEG